MQLAMYQRIGLRAKGESTGKTIVTEVRLCGGLWPWETTDYGSMENQWGKLKQQLRQASEMPNDSKHHANDNRKAIERSLVIAMRTQYEPRRGTVVILHVRP